LFRVENIVGPLVLNAQTSCGNYPPLQSVEAADLVLFVHSRPLEEGSGTTAYASSCQVDQHGRPISGVRLTSTLSLATHFLIQSEKSLCGAARRDQPFAPDRRSSERERSRGRNDGP
jgi:hypothetical protein